MKYTNEEFLQYNNLTNEVREVIQGLIDKKDDLLEDIKLDKKNIDLLEEKVYFALELLGNLKAWSKCLSKAKQKEFNQFFENSYVEL